MLYISIEYIIVKTILMITYNFVPACVCRKFLDYLQLGKPSSLLNLLIQKEYGCIYNIESLSVAYVAYCARASVLTDDAS